MAVDKNAFPKGGIFRVTEPHWAAGEVVEVYGYTSAKIRAVNEEGRGLLLPSDFLGPVNESR